MAMVKRRTLSGKLIGKREAKQVAQVAVEKRATLDEGDQHDRGVLEPVERLFHYLAGQKTKFREPYSR